MLRNMWPPILSTETAAMETEGIGIMPLKSIKQASLAVPTRPGHLPPTKWRRIFLYLLPAKGDTVSNSDGSDHSLSEKPDADKKNSLHTGKERGSGGASTPQDHFFVRSDDAKLSVCSVKYRRK